MHENQVSKDDGYESQIYQPSAAEAIIAFALSAQSGVLDCTKQLGQQAVSCLDNTVGRGIDYVTVYGAPKQVKALDQLRQ